jgi:hypothetical protein
MQTTQKEKTEMKPTIMKIELSSSIPLRNAVSGGSRMKRLLALIAVLGFVACGTGVANANDLYNGDLDILGAVGANGQNLAGPDGWAIYASMTISGADYDAADSETWCNVQQPGGYGLFFKPWTGNAALGDLLSVHFYQDLPATPGTLYTLSGYAAGEANYSGFFSTNSPAPQTLFVVEFLNAANTVIPGGSNALNLITAGLPNGGSGSMAQFTTPQFTAPPNTVTVRVGAFINNVYGTSGAQSFFVDAFDLESVAPPGSPVITTQPSSTTVAPGGNATLTIVATGATAYQWQLYGTNISNVPGHISGATGPTLTITGASAADVGHYRVRVSNTSGALYSATAPLALQSIAFYPVVRLTGKIGDTYRVDYSTAVAPTTWIPLSTNVLATSPQLLIDSTSPGANTRFYRSVFLH